MTRLDRLQRAEFINALQRIYRGVLTRQELQAPTLISVIFSKSFDLDNAKDIGVLISDLEYTIDNQLKPEMYDYISEGIKEITDLGVSHSVRNTLNVLGDSAFDFLSLGDRLALDYINNVGIDGLRLSDRVWGLSDKRAITKEVYEAIRSGDTEYGLAQKLEKVLGEGIPKSSIKRVANTELSRAYSHSKADILASEMDLLPNAEGYVEVKLSPAHRIYDICDHMQGTYKLENAPLPAFHPNCFTGDTLAFATDVSTKFVSETDGDIMDITTEKGTKLSVTPNHPMLSVNGFVAANILQKGDYLVSTGDRFESLARVKPDSKSVKSPIKDVVIPDSVTFSRVPSSVDFHSDGIFYKKVDIILSSSKLLNNTKSLVSKFFNNSKFVSRLVGFVKFVMLSSLYKFMLSTLLTQNSFMSFFSNLLSPVFRLKLVDRFLSFTMTSYLNIISQEDFPDSSSGDFKFLVERKLRDSSFIFADKIVDIKVRHFKGKVYNLETAGHWYTANSIIAHNCLCITRTFMKPKGMGGRVETLEGSIRDYKQGGATPIKQIETRTKVVDI